MKFYNLRANMVKIILYNFFQILFGIYGENEGLIFIVKHRTIKHNFFYICIPYRLKMKWHSTKFYKYNAFINTMN